MRRELFALQEIGFTPEIYSIWKGDAIWKGRIINRFSLLRLFSLVYWIPYWTWKKPHVFKEVLEELWTKPCPNLQNWNETFLALGFALVEARKLQQKKYLLLHGVWATMPATAVLALSRLIDVPFSMGAHAYDVFRKGGDWLLALKFRHALFVRTSSESTMKRIEALGVHSGKIKLIRRGLTTWTSRKNLELVCSNQLELLSVGRLVEKKGYFYQLRIAKELMKKKIPFRLRIVGGGPLMKFLTKECNRLGLAEHVQFLGSRSQAEIKSLYINSDAFLFTGIIAKNGDRDGIPNVIPEAMSSGCLILASTFAGASEAFIEDVSGFSLSPLRPGEWTKILSDFWYNPDSFKPMRELAFKYSKEAFDVKRTAASIVSVIQEKIA